MIDNVEKIYQTIIESCGYVTAEYIARKTKIDLKEVENILTSNRKFIKSFIKGSKGQDMYFIRTKFGRLSDIWKTFQHVNYMKYTRH